MTRLLHAPRTSTGPGHQNDFEILTRRQAWHALAKQDTSKRPPRKCTPQWRGSASAEPSKTLQLRSKLTRNVAKDNSRTGATKSTLRDSLKIRSLREFNARRVRTHGGRFRALERKRADLGHILAPRLSDSKQTHSGKRAGPAVPLRFLEGSKLFEKGWVQGRQHQLPPLHIEGGSGLELRLPNGWVEKLGLGLSRVGLAGVQYHVFSVCFARVGAAFAEVTKNTCPIQGALQNGRPLHQATDLRTWEFPRSSGHRPLNKTIQKVKHSEP